MNRSKIPCMSVEVMSLFLFPLLLSSSSFLYVDKKLPSIYPRCGAFLCDSRNITVTDANCKRESRQITVTWLVQ
jgi:hypothetical protein